MLTTVGHTMVHPFHGPVRIVGDTTRNLRDTPTRYLELETLDHPLRISVPLQNADLVGLRPLLDAAGVERIMGVLSAPSEKLEPTWSRRIKQYQFRLQSGDLDQRLAVMREIIRSRGEQPAPGAERDILRDVRDGLVAEVSLAIDVTSAEAEALINRAASGFRSEGEPSRPAERSDR